MGLGPCPCAQAGAGCPTGCRMSGRSRGAGCPGWRAGCPGWRGWSWCSLDRGAEFPVESAGCPGVAEVPDVRPLMLRPSCWCSSSEVAQAPDVRPLARMSGRCSFSSSVFFRRRFQASLVDDVVVPWRLHSSSSSLVFRQYLCMHTSGLSSSIPSSKVSSEHV